MPSTISAGTTAGTAIAVAGDTTGNLAFQTNGTTTAMTIDTSQNVGIGTASPSNRLDVSGNAGVTGNLLFNSGYGSAAVAYGCRAWVNFDGSGTPAIRASGNVSSITDGGVGVYTINFTTAMPDANYSIVTTCSTDASTIRTAQTWTEATTLASSCQLSTATVASAAVDCAVVTASIFR
jgi:hypothetical protein